jgi:hypothetical protein
MTAKRNPKLSDTDLRGHVLELFTVDEMVNKIIKPKLELLNILIAIRNSYPEVDAANIDKLIVSTRDECTPYLQMGTSKIKCRIRKEKRNKSTKDHHLNRQTQADEKVIKVKSLN